MRDRKSPIAAVLIGLLAVLAAAWVRQRAVDRLGPDFDEFADIQVAFRYAERMVPGRWSEIPEVVDSPEHPALVKLAYGLALREAGAREPEWDRVPQGQPLRPDARPAFLATRTVSAVAGLLQVLLEALVSPLGALWLAFDTYHAKYTAQASVEGLAGLFAVLAVLLFERALRQREPQGLVPSPPRLSPLPLLGAALLLGLATAAQYPFGLVVGLAFLPFLAWRGGDRPWLLAGAASVALLAFFAFNPYLWHDTFDRTWSAIVFTFRGAPAEPGRPPGMPWWYQLYYLTRSAPARWHPEVFPLGWLDMLLLPAAALGVPFAARHRPVWLAWAFASLLFLLIWPTKWPQDTLLARPPLTVLAGLGLVAVKERLLGRRLVSSGRL